MLLHLFLSTLIFQEKKIIKIQIRSIHLHFLLKKKKHYVSIPRGKDFYFLKCIRKCLDVNSKRHEKKLVQTVQKCWLVLRIFPLA